MHYVQGQEISPEDIVTAFLNKTTALNRVSTTYRFYMTKRQRQATATVDVVRTLEVDIEDAVALRVERGGKHPFNYHQFNQKEIECIRNDLLAWYDGNKRELPWRKPFNELASNKELGQRGYEGTFFDVAKFIYYGVLSVWVSEIMLQQTQVATVIPYYEKWMNKYPTIFDLAKADLEEVNQIWSGLGYYSRAKRLHESAQRVVQDFDGILPQSAKDLQEVSNETMGFVFRQVENIRYWSLHSWFVSLHSFWLEHLFL